MDGCGDLHGSLYGLDEGLVNMVSQLAGAEDCSFTKRREQKVNLANKKERGNPSLFVSSGEAKMRPRSKSFLKQVRAKRRRIFRPLAVAVSRYGAAKTAGCLFLEKRPAHFTYFVWQPSSASAQSCPRPNSKGDGIVPRRHSAFRCSTRL